MSEIVNKVAKSGIITFNLEEYYVPDENKLAFDLKDLLFHGLILKEKDFRQYIKEHDWEVYQDKLVAIYCSADAIVPTWAFMLVANKLQPYTKFTAFCSPEQLDTFYYQKVINEIEGEAYQDKIVVVKGCSDKPVPEAAYVAATNKLTPYVKTLMFGEPCSTVPIYKKPKPAK